MRSPFRRSGGIRFSPNGTDPVPHQPHHAVAVIGLALMVAASASWAARAWRREPGKLVATSPEIVWQAPASEPGKGGSASASFEVTNLGGEPVQIIATESGCGCATPIGESPLSANPIVVSVTVQGGDEP